MRTTVGIDELKSRLNLFIGKPVWTVTGGGSAGSTLLIYLGDKVRRDRRIENPDFSEEEREYEGELHLMISCAWRVEMEGIGVVSGSRDNEDEIMLSGPRKLIGETVAEVSVSSLLDLLVTFSGGVRLSVFCNRHTDNPDIDICYDLYIRDEEVCSVGSGVIFLDRTEETGNSPSPVI
jgi:hypothetical protein